MDWGEEERQSRRFQISKPDQRSDFQRDRDRLLYCSAFHRLAGITQIVRAGELDIFHTRQQHTYKVAQVGRRLAERCIIEQRKECEHQGVHPEVVEAACLAHDLGHPPFGHAAETVLDELVRGSDVEDGYEGNAQTFRILTKLSVRYGLEQCRGLDLTRATLAATLKYPWFRDLNDQKKKGKWSAYQSEKDDFEWAREFFPHDHKTAEAEIMDWADDIAYSVHDLEDFHRVGIIPWDLILSDRNRDSLVSETQAAWFGAPADAAGQIRGALDRIKEVFSLFPAIKDEPYDGSREQRRQLRNLTSILIGRYVKSLSLTGDNAGAAVTINRESAVEVRVLKQIARHYVIGLPALHAQQHGQKKIITELYEIFLRHSDNGSARFMPKRLTYLWESSDAQPPRLAADSVAALTENEAYQLHRRLTGVDGGTVLDPIVR